ncbi:MAG: (2Fe-2S) ferredoxin domain-containing protein, partial [Holophagales bacterium]|nr:(2Fe-2S) ferredoxin domain-containing protein [Holophagales bacterium]
MGTNITNLTIDQIGKRWVGFNDISADLLKNLKAEPFVSARKKGDEAISSLLASLRRETLECPAIFIGAGTCGLGAGAAKTIAAIKDFLKERKFEADVIEVGCNGMCSDEPIVDILIPGRTRLSFGPVTDEKAASLLDAVIFKSNIPENLVLGQYSNVNKGATLWEGVPLLEDHPFLKSQVRVVLGT